MKRKGRGGKGEGRIDRGGVIEQGRGDMTKHLREYGRKRSKTTKD